MDGNEAKEALERLAALQSRRQSQKNKADIDFIAEQISPFLQKTVKRHEDRQLGYVTDLDGLNPVREAEKLSSSVAQISARYHQLEDQLEYLNREYLDITHAIELLADDDSEKLLEYAEMMKRNRKDRRLVKDIIAAAGPFHEFLQKYPNLAGVTQKVLHDARKIVEMQKTRTYTPRETTVLAAAFEKAGISKK